MCEKSFNAAKKRLVRKLARLSAKASVFSYEEYSKWVKNYAHEEDPEAVALHRMIYKHIIRKFDPDSII